MKVKIKGYITARVDLIQQPPVMEYIFTNADMEFLSDKYSVYKTICEHEIEVEVPDDLDTRQVRITALKIEEQKLRAEFGKRITEIEDQISKLTAIECNHE